MLAGISSVKNTPAAPKGGGDGGDVIRCVMRSENFIFSTIEVCQQTTVVALGTAWTAMTVHSLVAEKRWPRA